MWYITLIDLNILKNPCIPGINTTWSWGMRFFDVLQSSFWQNFVEDFCIYVHQWYWPVVFFFCDIFVRFWYVCAGGKRDMFCIVAMGFPCGSAGKESACNAGDLGLIPGLGRSPGEWKGYPLQYSGLENSMDCIIHGRKELDMTERLPLHFTSALQIFSPRPANAVLLSTDRCLHDHSSKTQDIPSLIWNMNPY